MAERLPAGTAARLTAAMDTRTVAMARDGIQEDSPQPLESSPWTKARPTRTPLRPRFSTAWPSFSICSRSASATPHPASSTRKRIAAARSTASTGFHWRRSDRCPLQKRPRPRHPPASRLAFSRRTLPGRTRRWPGGPRSRSKMPRLPRASCSRRARRGCRRSSLPKHRRLRRSHRPIPPKTTHPATSRTQSDAAASSTPPADVVLDAARAAIPLDLLARLAAHQGCNGPAPASRARRARPCAACAAARPACAKQPLATASASMSWKRSARPHPGSACGAPRLARRMKGS